MDMPRPFDSRSPALPAWLLLAALAGCSDRASEPVNELQRLQLKCSRDAAADFESGKNNFGGISANFHNHYNTRLKKCFSIITTVYGTGPYKVLYDVNENKDYGRFGIYMPMHGFAPSTCEVQEKSCQSEQEWDALVQPFMQD